jgi:GT2 family glycosyltransferase
MDATFLLETTESGAIPDRGDPDNMLTSIVILTHNEWAVTKACLESIRLHTPEPYELIVVDNGSTDETSQSLKDQQDVKLIRNETNLGFPKGCNQGIEAASGDSVLFLNNDTVVTENWLKNLLRELYSDERVGMVGPVSNYVSGQQQIPVKYHELSDLDRFAKEHCEQHSGQWVSARRLVGFCLLVKRSVLNEIGLFDERFGIGNYEDDDLCLRALQAGYSLRIVYDSFVHHVGHVTVRNITDVNFTQLLVQNKLKAAEKWGQNIHDLMFEMPITISLCMIVKNEQETIARCLDSIRDIVDEIIVVDTGSTDDTVEILKRYTDKIYHFEWIDDFSAARNFAFAQATMDYILWLDADDVIYEKDRKKLAELKQSLNFSIDSVSMEYHLSFDQDGNVTSKSRRNRLVKRANKFRWHGAVHEYLLVGGNILNSDIAITHISVEHESDRNIRIYEARLARGETFEPRDLYYYANELLDHRRFQDAAAVYEQFLNTHQGWIEDVIAACGKLADCYHNLNQPDKEQEYTLRSFLYDTPRADFCCRMGYYFLQKSEWTKAAFWYELATNLPKPDVNWGFVNSACSTWLPHLQLCVCYDRMGDYRKAFEHNEIARRYRPTEEFLLLNKAYLESRLSEDEL